MQEVSAEHYTCVGAGVDWLTASGDRDYKTSTFQQVGSNILHTQTLAGVEVKPASVRDYKGYRGEGIFVGRRSTDTLIVLSGQTADDHFDDVTNAASNVSRIDVQTTIYTDGEETHLARDLYKYLKARPARRGRPTSYTYIEQHPHGETLNYGKRSSDAYGRFYDKGIEGKLADAGLLWRAECEFKRAHAVGLSRRLAGVPHRRWAVESVVAAWWLQRGVRLPSTVDRANPIDFRLSPSKQTDVLRWMRSSLSKTVATQIMRHGIEEVVDALGLSDYVEVKRAKRIRDRH